jgi:hypothetical protein
MLLTITQSNDSTKPNHSHSKQEFYLMLNMERILPLFMAVRRAEKLGPRDQQAE